MGGKALALAALAALLIFAAPASGASKNVKLVDNLPEAKDATAINFLSYGKKSRHGGSRDVMLGPVRPEVVLAEESVEPTSARRGDRRRAATAG